MASSKASGRSAQRSAGASVCGGMNMSKRLSSVLPLGLKTMSAGVPRTLNRSESRLVSGASSSVQSSLKRTK